MANSTQIVGSVFASGNGTNAENILRFALKNPDKIKIPVVICDQPEAGVIERAKKLGVECAVIPVTKSRTEQEKKILETLSARNVEWVFLAGYMRIISKDFISRFPNHIVNIHPSLLPEFPGKDSYAKAYEAGVKTAGVTLHVVDAGVDTGAVIKQKKFDRVENESFEEFRARGMALEYEVYTEFLKELCDGQGRQDRDRTENSRSASGEIRTRSA